MKILILSAYEAKSHQQWREGLLRQFPEHEWSSLVLPPRHFSWRIRGNSLYWARAEGQVLEQHYDLILATSMVDVSSLRGMRKSLQRTPCVLYFHENQFAYPVSSQQAHSLEPKIVNLYSALSSEMLVFNSHYNLESFLQGVKGLLDKMPDYVPEGIVEELRAKARVVPVPIDDSWFTIKTEAQKKPKVLEVVWNHRWEYDKGPERLLALFKHFISLSKHLAHLRVNIIGQSFRQQPPMFEELKHRLEEVKLVGHWAYVESREQYRQILSEADIVLSTAVHDFQGLSVLEAVAAGAVPVVPDRLAYQELFPEEYRYPSLLDNLEGEAKQAALALENRLSSLIQPLDIKLGPPRAPDLKHLSWRNLRDEYQRLFEAPGIQR